MRSPHLKHTFVLDIYMKKNCSGSFASITSALLVMFFAVSCKVGIFVQTFSVPENPAYNPQPLLYPQRVADNFHAVDQMCKNVEEKINKKRFVYIYAR